MKQSMCYVMTLTAVVVLIATLAACAPSSTSSATTAPSTAATTTITPAPSSSPTTAPATAPATVADTSTQAAPAASPTLKPAATTAPSSAPSPTATATKVATASPTATLKPPTATPTVFVPLLSFVATWHNTNSKTGSWIRIEITAKGNTVSAHFFGNCTPTECDAGIGTAAYTGNPFTVSVDSGFATRKHTLTLADAALHVTTFTHFTDKSGRVDFSSEDDFKK